MLNDLFIFSGGKWPLANQALYSLLSGLSLAFLSKPSYLHSTFFWTHSLKSALSGRLTAAERDKPAFSMPLDIVCLVHKPPHIQLWGKNCTTKSNAFFFLSHLTSKRKIEQHYDPLISIKNEANTVIASQLFYTIPCFCGSGKTYIEVNELYLASEVLLFLFLTKHPYPSKNTGIVCRSCFSESHHYGPWYCFY